MASHELAVRQAAGLYEAMSLRYYRRYLEFLDTSEAIAGETLARGRPDDLASATGRYRELMKSWVEEPPSGAQAVSALLDFATLIAVEALAAETMLDLAIGAEDVLDQALALNTAARWINENVAIPETLRSLRAQRVQDGAAP